MNCGEQLRDLLRPLGVYNLEHNSLSGAELDALGVGLDGVAAYLDYVEREGALSTAEGEGLSRRESLFARTGILYSTELRREAIAALLRIGRDCPTLESINNTISGCGVKAVVAETGEANHVRVSFPDVRGRPQGFGQVEEIIRDILPIHLIVDFFFNLMTWADCHRKAFTWKMIHNAGYNWTEFQLAA